MATVGNMPTVERISESRLRRVLDRLKFRHRIDEDGDIVGILEADEDCPYNVVWFVRLLGENKDVLVIQLYGGREVSERDQGRAVLACNKWNNEMLWPKAYLSTGSEARIGGEEAISLSAGIHDELLSDFIKNVLSAGWRMFVAISKEGL